MLLERMPVLEGKSTEAALGMDSSMLAPTVCELLYAVGENGFIDFLFMAYIISHWAFFERVEDGLFFR